MKKKTILVLAYTVSPLRGSEYSVGWNYVKEMSRSNNLIVLYGAAGKHMGDVQEIEESEHCRNLPNVQFIAVKPNFLTNLLNGLNKKGLFIYTFYFAYKLWHRQAYKVARYIVAAQSIDIIHYVGMIGYREPGYLWKIDKPFIWGPIGGVTKFPVVPAFQRSLLGGIKTVFRNIVNFLQFKYSPRVVAALTRTDLLLASTSETSRMIRNVHGVEALHMPENAITGEMLRNQRIVRVAPNETVKIIWVGRVDEWKALEILLAALENINTKNWHLSVVGAGARLGRCKEMAVRRGLSDRITWVGAVSREEVNAYYRSSHLHAITSLMEANTTVLWEAMSFGLPTVTLDHCGMHDTVCEACGVKIPVRSLDEIVTSYAERLEKLLSEPSLITDLSRGVSECSKRYTWDMRRQKWELLYEAAISAWQKRKEGSWS